MEMELRTVKGMMPDGSITNSNEVSIFNPPSNISNLPHSFYKLQEWITKQKLRVEHIASSNCHTLVIENKYKGVDAPLVFNKYVKLYNKERSRRNCKNLIRNNTTGSCYIPIYNEVENLRTFLLRKAYINIKIKSYRYKESTDEYFFQLKVGKDDVPTFNCVVGDNTKLITKNAVEDKLRDFMKEKIGSIYISDIDMVYSEGDYYITLSFKDKTPLGYVVEETTHTNNNIPQFLTPTIAKELLQRGYNYIARDYNLNYYIAYTDKPVIEEEKKEWVNGLTNNHGLYQYKVIDNKDWKDSLVNLNDYYILNEYYGKEVKKEEKVNNTNIADGICDGIARYYGYDKTMSDIMKPQKLEYKGELNNFVFIIGSEEEAKWLFNDYFPLFNLSIDNKGEELIKYDTALKQRYLNCNYIEIIAKEVWGHDYSVYKEIKENKIEVKVKDLMKLASKLKG